MAKKKTRHRSLADPADLQPFDGNGKIQVVIETPKGSRNNTPSTPICEFFRLRKFSQPA